MEKYHKAQRGPYWGALLSVLISTVLAVWLQFYKGKVLDSALAGAVGQTLSFALILLGLILGEVALFYLYRRLSARFVTGCTKSLKRDIFDSVLRRGFTQFLDRPQGEYIAKFTQEAEVIEDRRFSLLPALWEILFKVILVAGALFLLDWRIATLTLILLTTPLYVPKIIDKRLQKAQAEHLAAVEACLVSVNDWLGGFEVIKNFAIERRILARFDRVNDEAMSKKLADQDLGALAQLITSLLSYLSYFLVLACAAWLVLTGRFSAGDFFVAIGMIDQLSYPLIALAGILRLLVAVKPTCDEMVTFLDVSGTLDGNVSPTVINEQIRFCDVDFAYPDSPPILRNFSLSLRPKGHYLLRGPSGCGKTTAINLLMKYHDPDGGQICLDDKDITQVDSTYGLITVLRQEPTLFLDSLKNNLTLYQDVDEPLIIQALQAVGLDKFANAQGLDALITEDGSNLSGGEKRRVALARALLRQTPVIILDEPLANLDPDTASRIEDLLLDIRDRLVVIVSHQFSEHKLCQFDQVVDMGVAMP